ncbi:MAG: YvcK family protein [Oscillospiraceae bacterium]|nr:YvcK family protein [Oscillospiraceae bacterium]
MKDHSQIVAIGGGTGLSTMLRGLKRHTDRITAIVTVADDGGGSGILRQEMGMLPPGDIRNCITALSNAEPMMRDLLGYRFSEGGLAGQSFGNLFLAALNEVTGSFYQAVRYLSNILNITGRVLPVTVEDIRLEAEFENGVCVLGESRIFEAKKEQDSPIKRVRLIPEYPCALEESLDAIENADLLVLGPGSLYTSILPNLLVSGVVGAINRSNAKKIYVCNIMTQEGETEGYTAFDHVKALFDHAGCKLFDHCLVNETPIGKELLEKYEKEAAEAIVVDSERFDAAGVTLHYAPLASDDKRYARHDPELLAEALMKLMEE